jgi:cytochrome b6-f complex iron-sulfur subunit
MNRRELIRNIAAGTATLFVVPTAITSCEEDLPEPDNNNNNSNNNNLLTIDLGEDKYKGLVTAGGFVVEGNIIIFNTGNQFVALSKICTHTGCEVSYNHGNGNLPCPCHGSVFSTSGTVINGPADSPLKKYDLSQEGDVLTIAL